MRGLLEYIVRGRFEAITATTACAGLSPVFPPLSYISGAVVGLATLRYGLYEGLLVVAGATLLSGILANLLLHTTMPAVAMFCVTWAPVWLLAVVLRVSASQGLVLATAGLLGVAAILGFHVVVDNSVEWWRDVLDKLLTLGLKESQLYPDAQALERFDLVLDALAPVMTGVLVSGLILGSVVTVLLARWWHSALDNPGGFGKEFRALKLDRRIGIAVLAVVLMTVFADEATGGAGREFLCVAMVLYLFQGLALAHSAVALSGASTAWLLGLYLLVVIGTAVRPEIIFLLSLTGFLDTWLNFRGRWSARARNN